MPLLLDESLTNLLLNEAKSVRPAVVKIGKEIFQHPELSGEEVRAHDVLCNFLQRHDFRVTRNFILPTAFKAEFSIKMNQSGSETPTNSSPMATDVEAVSSDLGDRAHTSGNILTFGLICEYDALPELGHAAGKNLISVATLFAALMMKKFFLETRTPHKIIVFGCPCEERGHGKATLLDSQAFQTLSCVLMCSPNATNTATPATCAQISLQVCYKGKSAHATASPWEGRNALDAAVACYNNMALLRQQLRPSQMVSTTITRGGLMPNVVPSRAEMELWLRATDLPELYLLKNKVWQCIMSGSKATACEVTLRFDEVQVLPTRQNSFLASLYNQYAAIVGISMDPFSGGLAVAASECAKKMMSCRSTGYTTPTHFSSSNLQGLAEQDAMDNDITSDAPRKSNSGEESPGAMWDALAHTNLMRGTEVTFQQFIGSSDLGNVSQQVPCLLASFALDFRVSKNTEHFAELCNKSEAYGEMKMTRAVFVTCSNFLRSDAAFKAGQVMGLLCAEICMDPDNNLCSIWKAYQDQEQQSSLPNRLHILRETMSLMEVLE